MRSAYNETWLRNLSIVKEAKRWKEHNIINAEQLTAIGEEYKSSFFHPNLMIRILLFIATLIALGGVTGILALMFADGFNNEHVMFVLSVFYGVASFAVLEFIFLKNSKHYKSGVTEAILYHAIGFTLLGIAGIADFDETGVILMCLFLFSFSAYRYLDLISTAGAFISLAYFIFNELFMIGEATQQPLFQQVIPIVFIVFFVPLYFLFKKWQRNISATPWKSCLILLEALSLLTIYASGNYFVVRELSVSMLNMYLEEGQDIPFAFVFYFLTVIMPVIYLYFGIKNKDLVLLRVSLVVIAFSVFTFKYYFSLGHHEITLTGGDIVLLAISLYLFRYLKTPKHGYTRENLLKEKWAGANPEAFVITQTLGGNQVTTNDASGGGGGSFSGGGSTDSY